MLGKRNKSTERERERESKGTRAREKSTKYTAVGSGQKKGVSKVCFFFSFTPVSACFCKGHLE